MRKYLIMPHIHYSASHLNTFCCSRHSEILPFLPGFCHLYISACPLYRASTESPHVGYCSRCSILGWPKSLFIFFPNHLMDKSKIQSNILFNAHNSPAHKHFCPPLQIKKLKLRESETPWLHSGRAGIWVTATAPLTIIFPLSWAPRIHPRGSIFP